MKGCSRHLASSIIFLSIVFLASIAVSAQTTVTVVGDSAYAANFAWTQQVAKLFEAANPDIKIEVVKISYNLARLQVLLAGGVPVDISVSPPDWIDPLARSGVLEDLTPYLQRDNQYFQDWYPVSWKDYHWRQGTYGIPFELQMIGIFYNIDAFGATGVALPPNSWTYDDLRETARKLTVRDANNVITRHGFKFPTSRNWLPAVWAYGGDFFDDWNNPTRFTGNTPAVAAALNYWNDLVRLKAIQDRKTHAAQSITVAFPGQRIAMGLTNTIAMSNFSRITDFAWDVAPMPRGPAGHVPYLASRGWVMFHNSANKEAAWRVLKFLASPEAHRLFVEATGVIPPSRASITKDWLPKVQVPKNKQAFFQNIENARAPWPVPDSVFSIIQKEADAAIWGDKPARSALETMAELVPVALKELEK